MLRKGDMWRTKKKWRYGIVKWYKESTKSITMAEVAFDFVECRMRQEEKKSTSNI